MEHDVEGKIDEVVAGADKEMSQTALRCFWDSLGLEGEEGGYLVFEDAFLGQMRADRQEALYFRPGGWVIKTAGAAVKAGIVSALLALALAADQATGIPVLVLPAVAPLLFDLEKVRLTRSEEQILIELTWKQDVGAKSADEMYNALPVSIQNEITRLAFYDFLEKCRAAGLADLQKGPPSVVTEAQYVLRPPGSEHFRVRIQ